MESVDEKKARRVLIVDDEILNSIAIGKRLERRGLSVTTVSDDVSIFEIIEQKEIELVLLDIVMPKVDGLTLLKEIRTKYSKNDLPVIMVTAVDDSFDIVESFKIGASDYITKPLNIDVALARINAQLSFVDLHKTEIMKKALEAVNAMVTTYNHEINNPLAIAFVALNSVRKNSKDLDITSLDKADAAIKRIAEIVKKIKEASEGKSIPFDSYVGSSKMVKIE